MINYYLIINFFRWLTLSADHIVILILLLALVVKFIFFENKEDFTEKIKASMSENLDSSDKTEFLKLNQQLKSKYLPETPVFKHSETFFLGRRYSDDKSDSSNGNYSYFGPGSVECIIKLTFINYRGGI